MATKYYVGDDAPSPLILTLRRSDGSIFDLSSYDTVTVEGDDLPPGDTMVLEPAEGIVQRVFDSGFETAGMLFLRVRLVNGDIVDFTDPTELAVYDPAPNTALLVTTGQVEAYTGRMVSENDIAQAQGIISLAVAADLTDTVWLAGLSTGDRYWLNLAVSYQAVTVDETTATTSVVAVYGAKSIANGDVSISFRDSAETQMPELGHRARVAIRRLSWMRPMRSVSATPFLRNDYDPVDAVVNGFGYRP